MLDQQESPIQDERVIDNPEYEYPDTVFIRDIENRVFKTIVLQCLAKIEGIELLEGHFIDSLFGRDNIEGIRGIQAEQDSQNLAVNVKVEVNIKYGLPIPEKANEIQTKIAQEITQLTGLHVACIHVVFKNLISYEAPQTEEDLEETDDSNQTSPMLIGGQLAEDYSEEY
ncbi:MAG: Asp23/Gls24 family envelope stress response protein [Chlamydiota bacterium]